VGRAFGRQVGFALALAVVLAIGAATRAWAQAKPTNGLTATVNAHTGDYAVMSRKPAWVFRGSVKARLRHLVRAAGHDRLGTFHLVRFSWNRQGVPVTAQVKTYDGRAIARFRLTYDRATPHPRIDFPDFTSLPAGLHVLSYRDVAFSPPQFAAGEHGTPWLLFDDHANAAILSPAGGFQVATLRGDGVYRAGAGLDDAVERVPAGYSVRLMLAVGSSIGRVYAEWGRALTTIHGKVRPSNEADRSLRYLGYWTDNGATYYYKYEKALGYAGTLLAEIRHLRSRGIPVGYLQLDSWWYPKDSLSYTGERLKVKNPEFQHARWNVFGGIWLYEASPALFPQGLAAFHRKVGLPFVVHSRWMGQDSPYHKQYRIAGVAPVDPGYWRHIARYLRRNGVVTYEQDWLSVIREYSGFNEHPGVGEAFFDHMAAAMRGQGLTMQYCMPTPSAMLQGSRYSNLTTSRVSDDEFVRARWFHFLFTSQLASALGIWPWADVATSQDADAMLLQTLSAGPVGFGDGIGKESRKNLMQAARADGVLIKPDVALVPIDRDYVDGTLGRHGPTIGTTFTKENGVKTAYVFAFARTPQDRGPVRFRAQTVGLHGAMAVYDYFAHRLTVVPAGGSFQGELGSDGASYYICATPGKSGIALLGDRYKFAGMGRMRIASVDDTSRQLEGTVVFARAERQVTLHGFARFEPRVSVEGGRAGTTDYDHATGEFTVTVSPDEHAALVKRNHWEPAVREVKVVFRRP
jgi:hypothetical protein